MPLSSNSASGTSVNMGERGMVLEERDGKIYRITLSRTAKKNALTPQMYEDFTNAMENAAKSDCAVTVITGKGEYFCAGTDLSSALVVDSQANAKIGRILIERFIATFIDHPKPLIGRVNGPAVGIGVTMLALFDSVYASDKATFLTPFTALGLTAEGCSSYTFPRLMGSSKATDVLLFGNKLTAEEAYRYRLISDVFPHGVFEQEVERRIKRFSELPSESLQLSKKLMRGWLREELHRANTAEMKLIEETWESADRRAAMAKFLSRRSNL